MNEKDKKVDWNKKYVFLSKERNDWALLTKAELVLWSKDGSIREGDYVIEIAKAKIGRENKKIVLENIPKA